PLGRKRRQRLLSPGLPWGIDTFHCMADLSLFFFQSSHFIVEFITIVLISSFIGKQDT
ncbi:MAG: hypothetical protein PWP25_644, partial [Sphaerochaeta sp.]|nr:hypothetical protein [Sphaerochaeta sp.]